jgi:serine O-acetyltransferase
MAGSLNQDYESHLLFTFAEIPSSPSWSNRVARARRWFTIAFAESWLAALLYRTKMRFRANGMLLLPTLCDMLSRTLFHVSIGDHVEIGPGLMMTHGHVVIDGRTRIGRNCQINPWVTIGLSNSKKLGFSVDGPTIGDHVHIGTGAKVLGPITVGDHARIGANAVVVHDVPPNVTVVGAPARVIGEQAPITTLAGDGSGRDQRLAAAMHDAVVSYKLRRQSLKSLVDALIGTFEIGSDSLRSAGDRLKEDLIFLDAVAATGGEESQQVVAAIDAIDGVVSNYRADIRG